MKRDRSAPCAPVLIIPARMASSRLPNKPLAAIGGEAMIVHVWRRAVECGIGPVIVACDGPEIRDAISAAGGTAVITDPAHPSGSDRIFEALRSTRDGFDAVINLQGDLPTIDPHAIHDVWSLLRDTEVDIGTLAAEIHTEEERSASQVVKAVLDIEPGARRGRALYFTRMAAPWGDGPHYHHIGIYAYRVDALKQFIEAPQSPLEIREKLEQLRALSLGLRIDAAIIGSAPFGVDTPADLERARALLGS